MERSGAAAAGTVVLGLGNRLLGDDAAGPLVIDRLARAPATSATLLDGGTVGLALLPAIEDAKALVAVDAARFGAPTGTVQVFEGGAMDALLAGRRCSAHEVALADLVGAAALTGRLPERRALVAVEPAQTDLGTGPSAAVAGALPVMCAAVERLLQRWAA
ncbi:MAG: hydrogenase maturation protease [Burkholderiales bacterium]|nr:hydrogenase maturation protease [Burkholderiales bacterium]